MPPLIAGRYRLLTPIGRGAMGQVWRARDETLQRDVAVKIVDLTHPTDASTAARFRREATAMAGLNNPHVVQIFDAGFDDPAEAFIAMELLTGPPLSDLMGRLPWREAVELTMQVAEGLAAAHAVGVIHRDIKPGNVMLHGDEGRRVAKVLDFGIARLTQAAEATLTAPATALGTAAYMSPEQATGEPLTPASDVYSLGCLLFALLTGRPPFTGEHPLAVLQMHVGQTPPLVSELDPSVPAAVDSLVARMLARDPAARPDDAGVLTAGRALLGRAEAGDTLTLPAVDTVSATAAPATVSASAVASRRRRSPLPWILALLVALLAAGAIAFAVIHARGPGVNDHGPTPTSSTRTPSRSSEPSTAAPSPSQTTEEPSREPSEPPTRVSTSPTAPPSTAEPTQPATTSSAPAPSSAGSPS